MDQITYCCYISVYTSGTTYFLFHLLYCCFVLCPMIWSLMIMWLIDCWLFKLVISNSWFSTCILTYLFGTVTMKTGISLRNPLQIEDKDSSRLRTQWKQKGCSTKYLCIYFTSTSLLISCFLAFYTSNIHVTWFW